MDEEVTTKDLYNLIKDLVVKSDEIQKQNTDIKEELKQEIRTIKAEVRAELEDIKQENIRLGEENKHLKDRLLQAERKLKKFNLVFYGVKERGNEIEEIQRLLEVINTKLHIDCRFADIRDSYRLGKLQTEKQQVRPVLVEFINYKLKLDILKNARNLKGTGIYIANDNTPEDYQKQKILRFHQKLAREKNQEAIIKNNTLFINGEPVLYQNLKERINEHIEEEEKGQEEEPKKAFDKIDAQKYPGSSRTTPLDDNDSEQSRKRKLKQNPDKDNPTKRITRPRPT